MLQKTIETVLALDDLRPSDMVNAAFSALVGAVIRDTTAEVDSAVCEQVQALSSEAESYMEVHWARRIIAAPSPKRELVQFPYADNYTELVHREIRLVEETGLQLTPHCQVCMIGTGPLPLTALELIRQRGVLVDHVDISKQALELCALVGERLDTYCGYIGGDGASVQFEQQYDLVVIAGLAGATMLEKQAIVDNVLPALAANGRLLIRSATGTRQLLYPAVSAQDFSGVILLREYHPDDYVINSVFVYKKA